MKTIGITEFDEIRPYNGEELPGVFEELIADPAFQKVVAGVIPDVPLEMLTQEMRVCKTELEFQKTFCHGLLWKLAGGCIDDISSDHTIIPDESKAYIYISNHWDIIPDSGFLPVLLVDQGMDTVEIAIGDNLLIYSWIKKFARVNKSLIMQRALTMRQMLESSARMSRYMHYMIGQKNQLIWIAQREGRAKDSGDHTQDSAFKMLAMDGEGDVVDRLTEMNIAPLAISYEYDPRDYLKAQEFQLRHDIEEYKETMEDNLKNMQIGLFGYRDKVHFRTRACLNDLLSTIDRSLPEPELLICTSTWVDERIHGNYRLCPGNYMAHGLLTSKNDSESHYILADRQRFEAYMEKQSEEIEIPDKDIPFLREKLLLMYANSLANYLVACQ